VVELESHYDQQMETPINFADQIYQIFKSKKRLALKGQELSEAFKKNTSRDLSISELKDLPFIQFANNRSNVFLVVELDDICTTCKFRYCKLLHTVDRSDKFALIYRHNHNSRNHKNNHKVSRIELPTIRLIQRLKDILNESPNRSMSFKQMLQSHNRRWPRFKTHEPSARSIGIRFKSTFLIWNDENTKEQMIKLKADNHKMDGMENQRRNDGKSRHGNLSRNGSYSKSTHSSKSNVIISSKKTNQSPWAKNKRSKAPQSATNNTNDHNGNHSVAQNHSVHADRPHSKRRQLNNQNNASLSNGVASNGSNQNNGPVMNGNGNGISTHSEAKPDHHRSPQSNSHNVPNGPTMNHSNTSNHSNSHNASPLVPKQSRKSSSFESAASNGDAETGDTMNGQHNDVDHRMNRRESRESRDSRESINKSLPPSSNSSMYNGHYGSGSQSQSQSSHSEAQTMPEQPHLSYVALKISPEWTDSKLIPDLVRHISQLTGKHISDAFIPHRARLGFFTAKTQRVANEFIKKARQRRFTCGGRSVTAEIVPLPPNDQSHGIGIQRQQTGHRVKVKNVNCIMGRKDFEAWVREHTKASIREVYDVEIVFPKVMRGASQCILMVDAPNDAYHIVDRIQDVKFRGMPLHFKHWIHPNAPDHHTSSTRMNGSARRGKMGNHLHRSRNNGSPHSNGVPVQQPIVLNRSKIKAVSKPQSGIWAKMADQRKKKTEPPAPSTNVHHQQQQQQLQSQTVTSHPTKVHHSSSNSSSRHGQYAQGPTSGTIPPRNPTPERPEHHVVAPPPVPSGYNANNAGLADNLSLVNNSSQHSNSMQPSQPTKPPKKSNSGRDTTPPSGNGTKPRVPPLINRYRSGGSNHSNGHHTNSNTVSRHDDGNGVQHGTDGNMNYQDGSGHNAIDGNTVEMCTQTAPPEMHQMEDSAQPLIQSQPEGMEEKQQHQQQYVEQQTYPQEQYQVQPQQPQYSVQHGTTECSVPEMIPQDVRVANSNEVNVNQTGAAFVDEGNQQNQNQNQLEQAVEGSQQQTQGLSLDPQQVQQQEQAQNALQQTEQVMPIQQQQIAQQMGQQIQPQMMQQQQTGQYSSPTKPQHGQHSNMHVQQQMAPQTPQTPATPHQPLHHLQQQQTQLNQQQHLQQQQMHPQHPQQHQQNVTIQMNGSAVNAPQAVPLNAAALQSMLSTHHQQQLPMNQVYLQQIQQIPHQNGGVAVPILQISQLQQLHSLQHRQQPQMLSALAAPFAQQQFAINNMMHPLPNVMYQIPNMYINNMPPPPSSFNNVKFHSTPTTVPQPQQNGTTTSNNFVSPPRPQQATMQINNGNIQNIQNVTLQTNSNINYASPPQPTNIASHSASSQQQQHAQSQHTLPRHPEPMQQPLPPQHQHNQNQNQNQQQFQQQQDHQHHQQQSLPPQSEHQPQSVQQPPPSQPQPQPQPVQQQQVQQPQHQAVQQQVHQPPPPQNAKIVHQHKRVPSPQPLQTQQRQSQRQPHQQSKLQHQNQRQHLQHPQGRSDNVKPVVPPRNQQSRPPPKKSSDPLDKLCKYCLLSTHDPSKCVWFNPNAMGKR